MNKTDRNLSILFLVRSGWYTPGNSYQYYVTNSSQSWQDSRMICQRLGGDLASVGLRNLSILR